MTTEMGIEGKNESPMSTIDDRAIHPAVRWAVGILVTVMIASAGAVGGFVLSHEHRVTTLEVAEVQNQRVLDRIEDMIKNLGTEVRSALQEIAVIKSNRYTNQNAQQDRAALMSEINILEQQLIELRKKIPDQIPPKWFKEEVEDLEQAVQGLVKEVTAIRTRVELLEKNK